MQKRSGYIFVFLVLLRFACFSQNENTKWYFGGNAGLDFMTTPPTILTNGALNTQEGSASVANSSGNLLFYTDGVIIWNAAHTPMANGTGLLGHFSTTQAALIVKQPGNATIYYVFAQDAQGGAGGITYSIVDMSLAAGMGSVTVKNIPVSTPTSEKLTAVKHCNGVDMWIISHEHNSNNFRANLLTPSGFNSTAVVSPVGTFYTVAADMGYLKASANGKKLGVAVRIIFGASTFELYDFDNSTGVVSNSLTLAGYNFSYGCEFSPDGTKFYGSVDGGNISVYQWDLCAGSNAAIVASQFTVASSTGFTGNMGSLQLAPDGKIYGSRLNQSYLDVINNPNGAGAACNYVIAGQSIAPKTCMEGLPNMYLSMQQHSPLSPFTSTVNYGLGCQTASFSWAYPSPTACAVSGYSVTGLLWDFGDPVTGAGNSSTLNNPSHAYSSIGSYTTSLIIYYSCGGGTDTLRQTININTPCVTINSSSITCASLGSATVSSLGTGPFSYTWMPSGQTGSVATGMIPGIYTVTVHNGAGNFTYTTTTVFTSSVPLTGNLSNSSSVTCNGAATGSAAITGIAGGSPAGQNYSWSNGIATYTNPAPTSLSAGFWSVTATDNLTGCHINQTFFITQPTAATLTLASNTPSACAGGSIVLTGTASGGTPGYTYSWTNGPSGATYTVTQASGGNYSYTLSSTDGNACTVSTAIAVSFINPPTLTVSDVSICPLQTGTLSASGAGTYTWNAFSPGSTFTDNPLNTTQYTVVGSALGCTASATASIIVKPAPSAPLFSSNSPVCQGSSLSFSCSPAASYTWTGPNAFSSHAQSNTLNPAALTAGGSYSLTITALNSCTASASVALVVKPLPVLMINPHNPGICANTTSVILNAVGNATLLSWQPAAGLSATGTPTVSASPAATTIYTLTGSLNGCTITAIDTVNVVPPPNPNISLSSGTTCAEALNGSANTITLTAGGANTYTISTPNDIFNSNPGGPITNLNTQPPHVAGVSTATLYGSNGVCTLSTIAVFTIVPNPTVSINSFTPVICAGQSFTYTSAGADSYTWSSATPNQTLYTTGNISVASPTTNAVFSVGGGSLGCNSALQSSSITVNPLPIINLGPNPAITCSSSPITLSASGSGTLYSWSPSLFLNGVQGSTVSANPPVQQSYTVLASLNSCTAQAMITVSVLPLPAPIIVATQTLLCLNQQLSLQASGGATYSWTAPNYQLHTGPHLQLLADNLNYAGLYTVVTTAANGCMASATTSIALQDNPYGYLKNGHVDQCVPFSGSYKFVPVNYASSDISATSWLVNNQAVSQGTAFTYYFTKVGDYLITGNISAKNGCANTVTMSVSAYEKPKANFSFSPEKPVEGFDEVIFTSSSEGKDINTFSWQLINNDLSNQKNGATAGYLFETAGTYPVALLIKNQWGCSDSVVKTITIEPDLTVYVPDAFTPNQDGRNETFYPVVRGIRSFSFAVFNRWGERIFSASSPENGWDGTYKGEACKEDVYVWKLEITGKNDQNKKMSGFVTLYR